VDILLVILHGDPARGGAERYTVDLALALAGRGHRVSLGARTFADLPSGVERVDLNGGGTIRNGQYQLFLDAMDAHAASRQYDIVHAMLPVRRCDVYHPHAGIAMEAVERGGALTRFRNRLNRRRRAFAAVERRLLEGERAPVVLCLSEVIKRTVQRYYSLPADRLAMLFNAVDLGRFDPAGQVEVGEALRRRHKIPEEAPLAAMIAQDFERKGLEQTLRAVSMRNGEGIRLIVAGRDDPAVYIRLAKQLGIGERVYFVGPVSDPRAIYAAADMLVLPTRHDPCSLVVLEALAMGLPVITTRCNGASEIMEDGVHGFVLDDPEDVPALAEAMGKVGEVERRGRMREACLALRGMLAHERHVGRLIEIYEGEKGRRD
jgi:UDP-glucose:(heptosyl)LPS alpha-1,3-glucosyltransferase